jgi:hypothetical protein
VQAIAPARRIHLVINMKGSRSLRGFVSEIAGYKTYPQKLFRQ